VCCYFVTCGNVLIIVVSMWPAGGLYRTLPFLEVKSTVGCWQAKIFLQGPDSDRPLHVTVGLSRKRFTHSYWSTYWPCSPQQAPDSCENSHCSNVL